MRTRIFSLLSAVALVYPAVAGDAKIVVRADKVLHTVSRHLTGACIEDVNHEIYGGIYSQMVFGESFQEPPPPTPIAGFNTLGGQWQVTDGVLQVTAADGPKLLAEAAPVGNGQVSVDVRFKDRTGGNAGLILRVHDARVGADSWVGYEVALNPAEQNLLLGRHRNNFEPIRTVACPVPVGEWVTLSAKLSGSSIEVFVNGKSLLRNDDGRNALPAGTVGLRAWHKQASFRNLHIRRGDQDEHLAFRQTESATEISGMWRPVQRGSARGRFHVEKERPFVGSQSQRITFESGRGSLGVENQGLNRRGMNFVAGKPYDGVVWVRTDSPTSVRLSLESRGGEQSYCHTDLQVSPNRWQRLAFTLTPEAGDTAGRFVVALERPGSVVVGYAFLQPGEWGRFKGLPVRRDVAEGLIDQGITVLRYGGSMVNNKAYQWQNMIGPRDQRQPYPGFWYPYSTNGWGIVDFMNFCEAAGFEYVPAFNLDQTPEAMAAFVEYAKAPPTSDWGRKRRADGHEKPYRLRYIELGNEEKVDAAYAAKFEALATAIWAKDPDVILVVGDFAYGKPIKDPTYFTGAASRITSLAGHRQILALAKKHKREVWFDVHIDTEGPGPSGTLLCLPSYVDALDKIADGAKHRVVVFEYNSNDHAMRRALGNALATNAIMRDGRLPIVTSANCLQPDRQNDNGWDQGLLFLDPSHTWLQPPGYVTQMLSRNYQPKLVQSSVTGGPGKLDVVATRSEDGKTLVLQVVNYGDSAIPAAIDLNAFRPAGTTAEVTTLSGALDAVNTSDKQSVAPKQNRWKHEMNKGVTHYTFEARSFTVVRFE